MYSQSLISRESRRCEISRVLIDGERNAAPERIRRSKGRYDTDTAALSAYHSGNKISE